MALNTEERNEPDETRRSLSDIFADFADRTSLIGPGYIKQSTRRRAKVFWSIVFVLILGSMTVHLYSLLANFLLFPKKTTLSLTFSPLRLPAITVCNTNLFRESQIAKTSIQLQNLVMKNYPDKYKYIIRKYITQKPCNGTGISCTNTEHSSGSSYDKEYKGGSDAGKGDGGGSGDGVDNGNGSTTERGSQNETGSADANSGQNGTGSADANSGQNGTGSAYDKISSWYDDYVQYVNKYEGDDKINDTFSGDKNRWLAILDQYKALFSNESREIRIEVGHQLDKMLMKCTFADSVCHPENFTLHQSHDYGNCYTLDSGVFVVRKPGYRQGISIILYLENTEYIRVFSDGTGARMVIHPPGSIPFPDENGIFIQSGFESNIAIRMIKINRIEHPYGTCATDKDFEDMYERDYNKLSCQHLCVSTLTLKNCECYDLEHIEALADTRAMDKFNLCRSAKEVQCMDRIAMEYQQGKQTCKCPDRCDDKTYKKTISVRKWPTKEVSTLLRQEVCKEFPNEAFCSEPEDLKHRKYFAKINMFYEDLNFAVLEETKAIENSQFASDFGGTVGLWIGLCALSVIEVGHLIVELVVVIKKAISRQS